MVRTRSFPGRLAVSATIALSICAAVVHESYRRDETDSLSSPGGLTRAAPLWPGRPDSARDAAGGEPGSEPLADRASTERLVLRGRVVDSRARGVAGVPVVAWSVEALATQLSRARSRGGSPAAGSLSESEQRDAVRDAASRMARELPRVTSGPGGTYELPVTPGHWQLLVASESYRGGAPGTMVDVAGAPVEQDIPVVAAERIAGTVTDESGQPLRDALVEARRERRSRVESPEESLARLVAAVITGGGTARSNAEGRFDIPSLEPGRYTLLARGTGLAEGRLEGVVAGTRDAHLELERGVALKGRVVDSEQVPTAGAVLRLAALGLPSHESPLHDQVTSPPGSVTSDTDGSFVLRGVRAGSYLLRVEATRSPGLLVSVEVDGGDVELPTLVLPASHPLAGVVLDPSGNPAVGLRVEVPRPFSSRFPSDPLARWADAGLPPLPAHLGADLTDEGGAFRIEGLPAGELSLRVTGGPLGFALRRGVRSEDSPLVLRLEEGRQLRGRVVDDSTDGPVDGAEILWHPGGGLVRAVTGSDGEFTIDVPAGGGDAEAGPGWLEISHPGYGTLHRALESQKDEAPILECRLSPIRVLRGRVVDESGSAVRGAAVKLADGAAAGLLDAVRPNAARSSATTDAEGSFSLRATGGQRHELHVTRAGFAPARVAVDRRGTDDGAGIEIVLERGTRLAGRVLGPDGLGVSGAWVLLSDLETAVEREAITEDGGEYRFEHLPRGSYGVEAGASGLVGVGRFDIELEGGTEELDLELAEGWSISGEVVDSDGAPVSGAEVRVHFSHFSDAPEDEPDRTLGDEASAAAVTRAAAGSADTPIASHRAGGDGVFTIADLPPASLRLNVRADGFAPASVDLPGAEAGGTRGQSVIVVLHRLARVRVAVVGDEEPLVDFDAVVHRLEESSRTLVFSTHPGFRAPDGALEIALAAGRYLLTVRSSGHLTHREEFDLAAGETFDEVIELDDGARLEGLVRDAVTGESLPGAAVSCVARASTIAELFDPDRRRGTARTDADGAFDIGGLPEGVFDLEVSLEGYLLTEPIVVELDGRRRLEVEVRLAGTGRVFGRVVSAERGGGGESYLLLRPTGGSGSEAGEPHAMPGRTVPLEPDGTFDAELVAGRYTAVLSAGGDLYPLSGGIELEAGDVVDVVLEPRA